MKAKTNYLYSASLTALCSIIIIINITQFRSWKVQLCREGKMNNTFATLLAFMYSLVLSSMSFLASVLFTLWNAMNSQIECDKFSNMLLGGGRTMKLKEEQKVTGVGGTVTVWSTEPFAYVRCSWILVFSNIPHLFKWVVFSPQSFQI